MHWSRTRGLSSVRFTSALLNLLSNNDRTAYGPWRQYLGKVASKLGCSGWTVCFTGTSNIARDFRYAKDSLSNFLSIPVHKFWIQAIPVLSQLTRNVVEICINNKGIALRRENPSGNTPLRMS